MKPTFTRNQTWLVVRNMNFIFHILGIPADEIRFFRGAGSTTNQISIRNINNIYSIYIYSDPIYIYNYIYNIIKKYRYLSYRNIDIYYIEIYIYIHNIYSYPNYCFTICLFSHWQSTRNSGATEVMEMAMAGGPG